MAKTKKFILLPGAGDHHEPSRGKVYRAEKDGPPVIVQHEEDLVEKFPGKFRRYDGAEDLTPIGDVDDEDLPKKKVVIDEDEDEDAESTKVETEDEEDEEEVKPKRGRKR